MTRRSALLALLLAPFAWLARRWRRSELPAPPDGFRRLDTPVVFERGVPIGFVASSKVTYYESVDQRGPDEVECATPFSRLRGTELPGWRFSDEKVDWQIKRRS